MQPTSTEAPARLVRFGNFEVDLESGELRRKGLKVRLQEQPRRILEVLLEQPGEVVTREELRRKLWQPDTFVDFDHSLNTAMMRLREILGDSPDHPRFIETVPRRGYRFIFAVQQISREHAPAPHVASVDHPIADNRTANVQVTDRSTIPAVQTPSEPLLITAGPRQVELRRAAFAALAAFLLMLVAVALVLHWQGKLWPSQASRHGMSLVVLPMENLSGEPSQEYFADGMTDELIASLARVSSLRVISHTTSMEYKGTHESLEKIAHDLNVDAVVEGTVLRSGNRVRITAELVQVSTDGHLWADTYEGPIGDVLTLQNQVASAIVRQIRIQLTPQDKRRLAASQSINAQAYEDYLKGRYYWGQRSEAALTTAIRYFSYATAKDPQYALAYAGLADCYGIVGSAIVGTVPTSAVAPKAQAAAIRAVELDPSLAETQTALATVEFNYNWNWPSAETGFRRAIELNPNYATAHQRYSLYLMAMNRTSQSLDEMNRARSLDPLSLSMNLSLGWRLYMARRYDEADAQLRNTIEMDPKYLLAHIVLGQSYEQQGRYPEAIAELRAAEALSPNSPPVIAALGHAEALAGQRAEALKRLDQLKAESSAEYVSPFYVALLETGLKDRAAAVAWLDRGYDDRSNNMVF